MAKQPKYMDRVEFWDDERSMGNSLIVTLHYGWSFEPGGHEGVKGFDTAKEARAAIRDCWPCICEECQAKIKKVIARPLPGGCYQYLAVNDSGHEIALRQRATRLYEKAFMYNRPIGVGSGMAAFFSYGKQPSAWAERNQEIKVLHIFSIGQEDGVSDKNQKAQEPQAKKAGHGGPRPGAGRKPTPAADKRTRVTVRLPRWMAEKLKAHGNQGQLIEAALQAYGVRREG